MPAAVAWLLAGLCRDGYLATGNSPTFGILPNVIVGAVCGAAFVFVPGLLAEPLVTERTTRVRNLLTISGLEYRARAAAYSFGEVRPFATGMLPRRGTS